MDMNKKYKTFSITTYYRGVELILLCVTTSKKRLSELSGISQSHVNSHANSYDLRYPICTENPEELFAKPGLGGESFYIFNRYEIKPIKEYRKLIDSHRELYISHQDYLEKTKKQ